MSAITATINIEPRTTSRLWSGRVLGAVIGLACLPIGMLWDVSHHSTIGRDTFWTPAHIVIQLGGMVPALLFAALAWRMTFQGREEDRAASVRIWGARAPLGVWVTMWGAMAMATSAPFDDWWHNTYGLDVKIVSPPHAILGLGMFAVGMGVLLFVFSAQNRAGAEAANGLGLLCAVAAGVLITLWADFTTEFTWPNAQHGARFYEVICTPFPLLLVLAARAARIRGAATIAAATYMGIYILMILALPLFPAHPKLAPIYHPVDHMVPPAFPLLLIVPAVVIDLIEWAWGRRGSQEPMSASRDWAMAVVIPVIFLALMLAVQWNFSAFLLSDAADNRFFARSGHWPYFAEMGPWVNTFWKNDPMTVKGVGLALLRGVIATRVGLWLGNYLLRLKR
jgi:hypothetical protein